MGRTDWRWFGGWIRDWSRIGGGCLGMAVFIAAASCIPKLKNKCSTQSDCTVGAKCVEGVCVIWDGEVAGNPCAENNGGCDSVPDGSCPPYVLPAVCPEQYLTDSHNCCVPGRDCQGAECQGGKCLPKIIVESTKTPFGIAASADKDVIVWGAGLNGLHKCRKDGTDEFQLASDANGISGVAIGHDEFYWVEWNGPNLKAIHADGSQEKTVAAVTDEETVSVRTNLSRVAVDDQNAYWAMEAPPSVWFAPLNNDSKDATAVTIGKKGVNFPYGVAIDSTHLYWSDNSTGYIYRRELASLKTYKDADVVAESEKAPRDLAVDGKRVYWTTVDGVRSIFKENLQAGPKTVATNLPGQHSSQSIVVDDQYVYWTTFEMQNNEVSINGTINRAPKTGGSVEVLAGGQKGPWEIAQDCKTIFWANRYNNNEFGTVVKVAK